MSGLLNNEKRAADLARSVSDNLGLEDLFVPEKSKRIIISSSMQQELVTGRVRVSAPALLTFGLGRLRDLCMPH